MDWRIGRHLGNYLIEGLIGRGGMGLVYRARDEHSDQIVALKLMAPELAASDAYRARFVQEAVLGPTLAHPNIVPIYESGEVDGELFIAMRLVEGRDLKAVIKQEGRLDLARTLRIFRQAASALDAAHAAGIVHRDVKPQNILVADAASPEDEEHVFITDFGLVRPMTSETSSSKTGQVFGSVPYMAPELIEGLPADGRADVYALGCVLYECLTGSVPYDRPNEVAALWANLHDDPPLVTAKRADVPAGIDDVVIRALSKHPDDRFLTCGEFLSDLEAGARRRIANLRHSYVRPLVQRIPRPKTEREVWSPNFFPELSRIRRESNKVNWRKVAAFVTAAFLLVALQVGRDGGIPRALSDAAAGVESAGRAALDTFTDRSRPSSTEEAALGKSGAARQSTAPPARALPGGAAVRRTDRDRDAAASASPHRAPARNGRLVYEYRTSDYTIGDLVVVQPDWSDRRVLVPGQDPAWSPRGDAIAFSDTNGRIALVTPDAGNVRTITDDSLQNRHPSWSPDGTQIVFDTRGIGLRVLTLHGGLPPRTILRGRAFEPDWSPRSSRIAFRFVSATTENSDIWIVKPDGSGLIRITDDPGWEGEPSWSPDGTRIVYSACSDPASSLQECRRDIFAVDISSGDVRRITHPAVDDDEFAPSWSPDGTTIVYSREQTLEDAYGEAELWLARLKSPIEYRQVTFTSVANEVRADWGPR